MNLFLTILRFFCLTGLLLCVNLRLDAQNATPKSENYKNWSLEQLLFAIDSGLLGKEIRLEYIEFYLQKAKKENSTEDVIIGYKKKIANVEEYNLKIIYADSLIELAHRLKDNNILGTAYDFKGYVEFVAKNYDESLKYGLQAIEYLKGTNDLYRFNRVKTYVGSTYYHQKEYPKSYKFFNEVTRYYKDNNDSYSHLRGYISNLFGLSKTAYRLEKNDTLSILIKEGYTNVKKLKNQDQPLETAYFSLIDGIYHHSFKNYPKSDSLLQVAIPEIKANSDFANEHLAYLFLGKNLWEQNKKEQALEYFEKTDSLYQAKGFVNAELTEAYTYIIDYYKEQKNTEKQLYYTDVLLQISNELQSKSKNLSEYLNANFNTKMLEETEAEIEKKQKKWGMFLVITLCLITVLGYFIFKSKKTKQQYQKQNTENQQEESVSENQKTIEVSNNSQIILKRLEKFEQDKGYLDKDITIEKLSKELITNRTTLSQALNEHRGGFKMYIKTLRIDNAINQLNNNSQLKHQNLDVLADTFGFGTRKSFTVAFQEVKGVSFSEFAKGLGEGFEVSEEE